MHESSLFQAFRVVIDSPGGGNLGIFGLGCAAARTLESFAYTRATVVQVNFATV